MCVNRLSLWETVIHQVANFEYPIQVTDVGVEGSTPDMWVRVLSHVSFEDSLCQICRLQHVSRCQTLVWHSHSGHSESLFGFNEIIFHPVTESPRKDFWSHLSAI